MADMSDHFRELMIEGAELDRAKLKQDIDRSVMMVTAPSPVIGYDQASVISHYAIDRDLSLKLGSAEEAQPVRPARRPNPLKAPLLEEALDHCGAGRPADQASPSSGGPTIPVRGADWICWMSATQTGSGCRP